MAKLTRSLQENIKELINHRMTNHGDIVRKLSHTTLGGPRFSAFIRRWEINVEPPPQEEAKNERASTDSRRIGRNSDVEEEEYFNGDDDEADTPPLSSAQQSLEVRKQRSAMAHSSLWGLVPPRTPPTPSLLDYGDDEEDIGPPPPPETSPLVPISKTLLKEIPQHHSPLPQAYRQAYGWLIVKYLGHLHFPAGAPPKRTTAFQCRCEDPARPPKAQLLPIRLSGKRRREDDDDGLLERLASKPKRMDLGAPRGDEPVSGRAAAMKPGDDPPKRMKLTFRPSSIAVTQSTSPVPSEPGAKDGDTG
ncbi:hypothetical protein PAXINDRAFT_7664 [Paxillus involutus ATCC 200175]|nr:hypothetical protein PAXINDRAFT_7664 [Paxillus involutus ATCC 200175]